MGVLERGEDTPALRRQLAGQIREQIERGLLEPGDKLPSAAAIAKDAGVHPDTAKAALAILAGEGLVRTVPRVGTVVMGEDPVHVEHVEGPAQIRVRMPTGPERQAMDIPRGVPLIIVTRPGYGDFSEEQHLGHVTVLEVGGGLPVESEESGPGEGGGGGADAEAGEVP